MPELPEVQTVVDDLNRKVLGKRILGVWFDWPRSLRDVSQKEFKKRTRNLKIVGISRRAKNIVFLLKNRRNEKYLMIIHPKMTGHILVKKGTISKNKYVHFIFRLSGGKTMSLFDVRKFAKVVFGPAEEIEKSEHLSGLGPEPLNPKLTEKIFGRIFEHEGRKIKQVLMDPGAIAGIGNIYSDEILWASRISPLRRADSLRKNELTRLYKGTRLILKKALKLRGTSISDFRDTSGKPGFYGRKLLAYGREGEPCARCLRPIKRVKIGGRSAHYCGRCQK